MDAQRLWRAVSRGVTVAVLWGLLSALLTRVLMRAVTLITEGTPEFSWVGTIGIAVFYIATLLPGAVALAYSTGRWPWLIFGGGIAFLAWTAVNIGAASTAYAEDLAAWQWAGLAVLLVAMTSVYAAQAALVYRGARRRRDARPTGLPTSTKHGG
jgi:hypothetical protein